MNIDKARKEIQYTKENNFRILKLNSIDEIKLSSEDVLALVPEIKEIKTLILDLSNNDLTDVSFLLQLSELSEISLTNNPNIDLPKNLKNSIERPAFSNSYLNKTEINDIIQYYNQLSEGKDYIYEAKVLVVGEPKAGKTTLTQKIKDNDSWIRMYKDRHSDSTIGVIVDNLSFPYNKDLNKLISAHFWDFGGQNIQYVLHQYFFTERSLYILLADSRKEFLNFDYWFEIIATLGKGCPVLVVLNENGGKPIKTFNINEYREEFGKSLDSIEERSVNFYDDTDNRFEQLKTEIINKISNLKHIGSPLPKTWVDVRRDIEELKKTKAYIEKEQFQEICIKNSILNKDYQEQVRDYLHDLGIALNYKNDANLRNKFILKPNWVIDALYVVLKDTVIERNKGMFEVSYVDNLWENEGYTSKDCEILLSLMQKGKFEIAYKLKENKFIVPILLPYKPPIQYKLKELNDIQTLIKYSFMPKGIVPRLIVRLHKSILTKNREQIVWNKGVLISHHSSIAEIIEREQSKQISIRVVGKNAIHSKELLTIIRNEIVGIHQDWFENRIKFDELVPCICDTCQKTDDKQFYRLSVLENALIKGKEVQCQTSFEFVNTRMLVEGVFIMSTNKEDQRESGNIIISGINNSNINITTNKEIQNSMIENQVVQSDSSRIINQNLDQIFEKISNTQSAELKSLTDEFFTLIDEKLVQENKLSAEQVEAVNKAKYSSDTKLKLKVGLPLAGLTGIDASVEHEFKMSKEIKADGVIRFLRKILGHDDLQTISPKQLED